MTDNVVEFPKAEMEVSFTPELDEDEIVMVTTFLMTQINGLALPFHLSVQLRLLSMCTVEQLRIENECRHLGERRTMRLCFLTPTCSSLPSSLRRRRLAQLGSAAWRFQLR